MHWPDDKMSLNCIKVDWWELIFPGKMGFAVYKHTKEQAYNCPGHGQTWPRNQYPSRHTTLNQRLFQRCVQMSIQCWFSVKPLNQHWIHVFQCCVPAGIFTFLNRSLSACNFTLTTSNGLMTTASVSPEHNPDRVNTCGEIKIKYL